MDPVWGVVGHRDRVVEAEHGSATSGSRKTVSPTQLKVGDYGFGLNRDP